MGAIAVGGFPSPASAAFDKVRLTDLSDVSFGLISGTADQSVSQSVCAYSSSNTSGYSVIGIGDGPGNSFSLTGGPAPLPYDVLWSEDANQTGGTMLVAGTAAGGFTSLALQQTCRSGPSASGSLTVTIRSATLGSARAGSYSGTLQITIAPE